MEQLAKLDRWASKGFFWLTCLSLLLGLVFSRGGDRVIPLTKYILAYLMFTGALSCRVADFRRVLQRPERMLASLVLIFAVMPGLTYLITRLFLKNYPLLATGVILISALPVGVTAGVFADLGRGSVSLAITLVAVTTLASGFATPFILNLLIGSQVPFDGFQMSLDLIKLLALPVVAGVALNERQLPAVEELRPLLGIFNKAGIVVTLWANAAVMAPQLTQYREGVLYSLFIVVLQLVLSYGSSILLARRLAMPLGDEMALGMSNAVRNVVAGVVIGMNYFPPAVTMPIIISIMLQPPVAVLVYQKYSLPSRAGTEANL
ncbi:MAG: bile acid:sodium symporter family protein [Limnochordia bacterium]|jgi:BASS family bile acid:Na+ symporter